MVFFGVQPHTLHMITGQPIVLRCGYVQQNAKKTIVQLCEKTVNKSKKHIQILKFWLSKIIQDTRNFNYNYIASVAV